MNPNLTLSLSRIFKCDAKTLFNAIGEGMLFKFTGAVKESMNIDFREGGKYHLEWKGHGTLDGEFKNISPHSKITFTWPTMGKEIKQTIHTLVTITIKETLDKCILTLKHEGFDGFLTLNEHDFGWDDALSDLDKSFRKANELDLSFRIKKTIGAPRAKVFAAVKEHKQMNQYFTANATQDFEAGKAIAWNFKGHPAMTLEISQVSANESIAFKWNDATICFSFRDKAADVCEVVIDASGWPTTQEGLTGSYRECEGWQNFLDCLAFYVSGKVSHS